MSNREICWMTAKQLAEAIAYRRLSSREVVTAHLDQIDQFNPRVNAVVTLTAESALRAADQADQAIASGKQAGALHGLPVLHKDMTPTQGVRTTFGSPLYADHVPTFDGLIVERLHRAGAVTLGKTNTPEFAAGSQTFNELFGPTLNPYDLSKTCGGSSGGSAVALACGMSPIAGGSDMGGSLRNPANFCNVVGFRTSPGRVPVWPADVGWSPLSVEGPMARTVADTALMLSAIAGPDARSPISLETPGEFFRKPLERDFQGVKIAWSRSLGGLPVDERVTRVLDSHRQVFTDLGCEISEDEPDFRDADEIFRAWRGWVMQCKFGQFSAARREELKETIRWDIERGEQLTGPQLGRAELLRTKLYHRVREFLDRYDFLVLPVNQVPPFDVNQPYVTEIQGAAMHSYIDWMKSAYYISVTGLPAISVPAGFTDDGLPVGVQIVGRSLDDFGVLQLAHAFEQLTEFWKKRPPIVESAQ